MSYPKFDIVIYHAPCMDGTAGAYVCKVHNNGHPCKYFGTKLGLESYDFPNVRNRNVCIVDISFTREIMIELYANSNYLICLDHHKTAKTQLQDLDFCIFDMKRSGAQLAWDTLLATRRPEFIDFIGGRDLWDFSKAGTNNFTTGLYKKLQDFELDEIFIIFDILANNTDPAFNEVRDEIMKYGKFYNAFKNEAVEYACKVATKCKMGEHTIWATECALDRSKAGNILAQRDDCEFAAIYRYNLKANEWYISLRSMDTKTDVSLVAQYYDGGGHRNAAGFTWRNELHKLFMPI